MKYGIMAEEYVGGIKVGSLKVIDLLKHFQRLGIEDRRDFSDALLAAGFNVEKIETIKALTQ